MARTLPNSRANRQKIDDADKYNRAQDRADDIDKALEDPQPGPVEDRAKKLR